MKLANTILFCMTTLTLGCAEPASMSDAGQPADGGGGGKADDTNFNIACGTIEVEFDVCQDEASVDECIAMVNDDFSDAPKCCRDGGAFGYCDIADSQWCADANDDLAACMEHEVQEICDDHRDRVYPMYEHCGDAVTCEDIAESYTSCVDNAPPDVDCEGFVREEYPWGRNCCTLDDFDEATCEAYHDESCDGISKELESCELEAPEEVDCQEVIRTQFPSGGDCCGLEIYEDVCEAYD